jgi:hypothetical protein
VELSGGEVPHLSKKELGEMKEACNRSSEHFIDGYNCAFQHLKVLLSYFQDNDPQMLRLLQVVGGVENAATCYKLIPPKTNI